MTGTNAYAMLGEQSTRRARVVDLGFGGVAIELDKQETLPESILAILHVPILPPVRVSLSRSGHNKPSKALIASAALSSPNHVARKF